MNTSGRPTDAELQILAILWRTGPTTVRAVHHELADGTAYTTTLKTMQRMAEKNLLERDESRRSHVYQAKRSEAQTQGVIVSDLIDRAFSGSAARLAMRALSTRRASSEEIEELRQLLDSIREQNGAPGLGSEDQI
ncbi:MAG: BlaI/MecI/CopY family transcriptional regulator [Acidobacteria bacterium]|nr:MAG: BlaI/MecI/CopY family transcriptional regulator [Acidobacteriota bacterium]